MTNAAFLDAIVQEPDDLSHRLVYADWLDDQGDAERAEFIRLQINRNSLSPCDPLHRASLIREAELLVRHERQWLGRLPSLVSRWRFQRGFVEDVTISCERLLAVGSELFRCAPIRRLQLRGTIYLPTLLGDNDSLLEKFAGLLCRIRVLDLNRDYLNEPAGLKLLTLPWLPRLEALHLAGNALSPGGVSVLADLPVLQSVQTLEFNSSSSTEFNALESVQRLLQSPHLKNLRHLYLAGTRQANLVVAWLRKAPICRQLRSLSLGHCNLSPDVVNELVNAGSLEKLEWLDLSFNFLEQASRTVAEARGVTNLRWLNLSRTSLGNQGAATLAETSLLGRLDGIDLSLNQIGDEGGEKMARYPHPSQLRTLDLIYNQLGIRSRKKLQRRFGANVCLFRR